MQHVALPTTALAVAASAAQPITALVVVANVARPTTAQVAKAIANQVAGKVAGVAQAVVVNVVQPITAQAAAVNVAQPTIVLVVVGNVAPHITARVRSAGCSADYRRWPAGHKGR